MMEQCIKVLTIMSRVAWTVTPSLKNVHSKGEPVASEEIIHALRCLLRALYRVLKVAALSGY